MNNTVLKTISILRFIATSHEGYTLAEICKNLGIAKSTVFDIVHTLESEKYLEPSSKRPLAYCLGLEAFRIGYNYLNGSSLDSAARPVLSNLSQRINETVFLSTRCGKNQLVYMMKFLSNSELQTISAVGTVRPLLSVAMGKAILAALPNKEVFDCITQDMYKDCSIPDIYDDTSLLLFLNKVRKMGYVIDRTAENSHFVRPVSAPILDISNQVLGAVSIVTISEHKSDDQIHALGKEIQKTALEISHRLGYTKDDLYAAAR